MPDGNALLPLPPLDVSEAIFEAEELRGIPLRAVTEFTAGAYQPQRPARRQKSQPSRHAELMLVVRKARKLAGSTMRSVVRPPRSLRKRGPAAQRGGEQGGATLVTGDDPLWTCPPAVAPLAARHVHV